VSDQEFLGILEQVASILNTLEIPHAVVGSVASSRFGLHRATMDVDIVTDLKPAQILGLVNALRPDFYIDEVLISQAIIQHSSFNALHLETGTKLDFFVLKPREYDRVALNRRSGESPSFMTAEDVLLGLSGIAWVMKPVNDNGMTFLVFYEPKQISILNICTNGQQRLVCWICSSERKKLDTSNSSVDATTISIIAMPQHPVQPDQNS
jgi:lipoate synthase